jgi:hypothetical protein
LSIQDDIFGTRHRYHPVPGDISIHHRGINISIDRTVSPDVIRDAAAYIEIEFPVIDNSRIADGSVDHSQNRSAIDLNITNGAESGEAVCATDL